MLGAFIHQWLSVLDKEFFEKTCDDVADSRFQSDDSFMDINRILPCPSLISDPLSVNLWYVRHISSPLLPLRRMMKKLSLDDRIWMNYKS